MKKFLLAIFLVATGALGSCLENDSRFRSEGGGCHDLSTGRIWSPASKTGVGYSEADGYCRSLSENGKSDWRLPTEAELRAVATLAASKHFRFSAHQFFWAGGAAEGGEAALFQLTTGESVVQ